MLRIFVFPSATVDPALSPSCLNGEQRLRSNMLALEVTKPVVSADPVALRGFPFERHIEPIGAAFLHARKLQHRLASSGVARSEWHARARSREWGDL